MAIPAAAHSATVSSIRMPAATAAAPIRTPPPVKVPGTNWKRHRVDPLNSRTVTTAANPGANWTSSISTGSIPNAVWPAWHAAETTNVMTTKVVTGSQILEAGLTVVSRFRSTAECGDEVLDLAGLFFGGWLFGLDGFDEVPT